jgi:CRP-like cAMP-binding protein
LGIVFQFFQLMPTLTLLENVMLPMELNNLYGKTERRERAMHLLETVEMADQAGKMPAAVSGGQQQRVAIARALANDPPLIVADEPTGNLDSKTAEKIFLLFEELVASGKTILMVTHDSDLARRASRTIVISDGEIVNEYLVKALASLTQDQLVEVARHVKPQVYSRGANIIREGEVGDKFYILLNGEAEVWLEQPGGGQILVNQLRAGNYFGEMALLGNGIRSATVKAVGDRPVKVAELDVKAFNSLVKESESLRTELGYIVEQRAAAKQIKSLASPKQSELSQVMKKMKAVSFKNGQDIIKQGELGESFFMIQSGEVEVLVRQDDQEIRVNKLKSGQYFGEMALLGDKRRSATVRALGSVQVVEIGETEFQRLIGASDEFKQQVHKDAGQRRDGLGGAKKSKRGA